MGTVLSDSGTPLRGLKYSLDLFKFAPDPALLSGLPCRGINALHVYAERADDMSVGDNEAHLDQIVADARQYGLYVIITVGGNFNQTFTRNFWTRYAPRYSGESHVIYEIQNEAYPAYPAQPVPQDVRQFEADVYVAIRKVALQTPVLLFSYPFFHDAYAVKQDVEAVKSLVLANPELPSGGEIRLDANAAIAFHGYADWLVGSGTTANTIQSLRCDPYDSYTLGCGMPDGRNWALIETELEFDPTNPGPLYTPLVSTYNQLGISWLSFVDLYSDLNTYWNQPIDNAVTADAYVAWNPDYGTYPGITFSISGPNSQTITRGQTAQLQVYLSTRQRAAGSYPSTSRFCFQWYEGYSGDRSRPIAGATASYVYVSPTQTTPYWAEVSDNCTTLNSTTATVTVEEPADPTVGFRTYYGYYVGAENGGGAGMTCTPTSLGPWETFTLVDRNGGSLESGDPVNIKASNGMYVVAEGGGGGAVNANRTTAAEWETFTIQKMTSSYTTTSGTIGYGDLVAFRSYYGYYLVAISGGGGELLCDRTSPAQWESFSLTAP